MFEVIDKWVHFQKNVQILLALVCLFQSGASISENVYLGVKSIHVMSQLLVNFVVKVLKLEYVRQTGILYECFNNLDTHSLKRQYFQCCILRAVIKENIQYWNLWN